MKKIIALFLALGVLVGLTGCGNYMMFDTNYTMNYAVVTEVGGHSVYKVDKWSDSDSDAVMFTTINGNYIWTCSVNTIMYKELPQHVATALETEGSFYFWGETY